MMTISMQEICPMLTKQPMTKPWGRWVAKTNNPYLIRLWRRVYRRNQNYLCFVYGPTGSGKSYTVLGLARRIDPNFTLDNVVFTTEEFYTLLNSGKLKQGAVILFEEIGVAAGRRRWYTDDNQVMSFVNQVFRTRNLIVFYTSPDLSLNDSQLAKLAHAHIECIGIDYHKHLNKFKIFDPIEWNAKKNDWFKHMVSYKRGGRLYKVEQWRMHKIPAAIAKAYEAKRSVFEAKLLQEAEQSAKEAQEKQVQHKHFTKEKLEEIVSDIVTHHEDYMDDRRFHVHKVMQNFKIGNPNAKTVKDAVREKMKNIGFLINW